MKTVGYVLPSFPVLSETFIGTEMRAMQRHGHRVVPIAFTRAVGQAQPADMDLARATTYLEDVPFSAAFSALRHLRLSTLQAAAFVAVQRALPARSLVFQALKLAAVAQRSRCTHLHAHFALSTAATAIVAARLTGISASFVGHGFDVYTSQRDLGTKLRHVNFAVAVCQDMADDFRRLAPNARVATVHCGVEAHRFTLDDSLQERVWRLLFVGRMVEKKGVDTLLKSLAQIPLERRPGVDLLGDGPQRTALERLADELGVATHVRFLGSRSADWIAEHGPHYVGLVAPFRVAANGDRDTGPVVAKEAMAMGLPVIASRLMGLREIVQDGRTGFLVPVEDVDALASAISRLVAMPETQRRAMGRAGRERLLELFTADAQAAALSACVEAA